MNNRLPPPDGCDELTLFYREDHAGMVDAHVRIASGTLQGRGRTLGAAVMDVGRAIMLDETVRDRESLIERMGGNQHGSGHDG